MRIMRECSYKIMPASRFIKTLSIALLLLPVLISAQQRIPFSEKTVKLDDGTLLLPYTKGEVKKDITGTYGQTFNRICSIIEAWDSINPPQGMEIDCFAYGERLEIYFRSYLCFNGQKYPEEGGPKLTISVNDLSSIAGRHVASGIYLCPQKVADFHGHPIYDVGGYEVTIVTKTELPFYIPLSREEYLEALIADEEKKDSEYSAPQASDYQATLQEMEKSYQMLLKTDKEAAEEFRQQMIDFKEEANKEMVAKRQDASPVALFKKELSAMSEEEKKSAAYHGGEDFSGLMPYGQTQYGDALVRVNPALMKTPSRSGIHLIALSWSVSSDDAAEADKPRLYNKGSEGFYHTDYLMSKLYDNKEIWDKIFSLCE